MQGVVREIFSVLGLTKLAADPIAIASLLSSSSLIRERDEMSCVFDKLLKEFKVVLTCLKF